MTLAELHVPITPRSPIAHGFCTPAQGELGAGTPTRDARSPHPTIQNPPCSVFFVFFEVLCGKGSGTTKATKSAKHGEPGPNAGTLMTPESVASVI